ncbi:MAG: FAD:protein FMN transferase [Bdellovibrionales bacterium]|nr:FAD:protein FMN transferase [Bdellovibrionales bacterium]
MMKSKKEFNRVRPLLGTFFKISVFTESKEEFNLEDLNCVFEYAKKMEEVFSLFSKKSELVLFNEVDLNQRISVSAEVYFLLEKALSLWQKTKGAFFPFQKNSSPLGFDSFQRGEVRTQKSSFCRHPFKFEKINNNYFVIKKTPALMDLNGIAKGYIVDQCVVLLQKCLTNGIIGGCVNAGGDLKFFGQGSRQINLKLGSRYQIINRTLISPRDAVATSSLSVSLTEPLSQTIYPLQLRSPLTSNGTVVVLADQCYQADAGTKVVLFGERPEIEQYCGDECVIALVFDERGELIESYGHAGVKCAV